MGTEGENQGFLACGRTGILSLDTIESNQPTKEQQKTSRQTETKTRQTKKVVNVNSKGEHIAKYGFQHSDVVQMQTLIISSMHRLD